MELLKLRTGARMEHVPYRGTQPALQDLMAGNIGLLFDTYSTLKPQFDAGSVLPLGIAAAGRAPFASAPEPTIIEGGIPDFVASSWCMLLAPAGTPHPIIEKVGADMKEAIAAPDVRDKLVGQGAVPQASTPRELQALIDTDRLRYGRIIREKGLKAE
jgi:tripartite-type tricarboxylate transporter receptor subunit TctC